MTGFGKSEITTSERKITVETRSLNGKQLDLSVKLPARYRQFEYEIRNRAAKVLQRGKTDIFITVETTATKPTSAAINSELFEAYTKQLMELSSQSGLGMSSEIYAMILSSVMRMPEVVSSDVDSVSDEEGAALLKAVDEALAAHDKFREQEGAILIADLLDRKSVV